ncbi:hypothetical protein K1T71_008081 [Dendrolimus kikuchii]|uniref:Uncharacterized protein n=1 Tax=Dendrolimus kikuchii TaxID=765133 RepID=A0ACC1CWB7_9NEOP|nr:hypothetical protein K1T71_008081 [Dendrolimus kikuchii]
MAASGASGARQQRRGPAPIASFDHDVSDEVRPPSSPETKQTFRLPEIREDPAGAAHPAQSVSEGGGVSLLPPEQRARSHSTPNASLHAPPAPRIDISRASSSSHHDSRDSSPELALFAGAGADGDEARARLELGFREDGALDLRSSTEELAFLEGAPPPPAHAPPPPPAPVSRRHSRKDSQSSEAALLAVSGRTSRLSSVGSQCSAHSALSGFSHASRVSRLSVVSGVSRSPSPHRMLLETSFCGPKPIETDPEVCAAAVEEHLLEIAKMNSPHAAAPPPPAPPPAGDARDHREVRTEATVESVPSAGSAAALRSPPAPVAATPIVAVPTAVVVVDGEKHLKETCNRARAEERRTRPKVKREPSEPEVYKSANRTKDIIRIKLKPDEDYDDDQNVEPERVSVVEVERSPARKPATLELEAAGVRAARPSLPPTSPGPTPPLARPPRDSRTPSPVGPPVSRKSSFCSLFKSRETIASPDSPSEALRRKRSLTEGRSRSKSRDRSATPTSAGKMRGSVLSLFRTPKRGPASPSPSSREGSPVVHTQRPLAAPTPVENARRLERLKYYEDTRDGIIHIPLRTPPDECPASGEPRRGSGPRTALAEVVTHREPPRPASAPATRPPAEPATAKASAEVCFNAKPSTRTVLPDGSIIIPLRSPTERSPEATFHQPNDAWSGEPQLDKTDEVVVSTTSPILGGPPEGRDAADGAEASPDREARDARLAPLNGTGSPKNGEDGRRRRKERLIFSTHVGSREQVFSTQFSITKTPSVTSEMSGSFPSFADSEEPKTSRSRDQQTSLVGDREKETSAPASGVPSPQEPPRDSSESEPSSEAAPSRAGNEVEKRGLVVQESFEEELPYVPTTLPLERSVALPMVPRPRALPGGAAAPRPPPPCAPPASPPDKLRIRLPRRARPASASASAPTATSRAARSRTRSGGDGAEARPKPEWIDFEELPERRKQPKRIQTLPAGTAQPPAVLFSYVEPERCRCECHAHSRSDDGDAALASTRLSSPPPPSEGEQPSTPRTSHPFVADFTPQTPVRVPASCRGDAHEAPGGCGAGAAGACPSRGCPPSPLPTRAFDTSPI